MSLISATGVHHIRLTVTDIDGSRAFYENVLGFKVAAESAGRPDDLPVRSDPAQLYGGVVFETNGMLFGLRPVADRSDRFDSTRVGLDHLSFSVPTIDDLYAIADRLTSAGIEHGEITDLESFGIVILSFTDPDGIHLELAAPRRASTPPEDG
ncbi:VOC family protein [Nocardia sp. BSTN01]|uniref:VOC family protein n=1 Tax=Nocardia sp. BSTN01 TaxID=2783665 RepID=UPI00188E52CA|nr:VOC family protein [Nocardia sp. BSTN01]MBF5001530.1 VOC family protein [Nocardia sp. BSTN01]